MLKYNGIKKKIFVEIFGLQNKISSFMQYKNPVWPQNFNVVNWHPDLLFIWYLWYF